MKRVRVEAPFRIGETGELLVRGDELDVSDEMLARIRAVGVNFVSVLGDVEEPVAEPVAEPVEEPIEEAPKKTAKGKAKK